MNRLRFWLALGCLLGTEAAKAVDIELVNDIPQPGVVAAAGQGAVLSATQFIFNVPTDASQVAFTLAADNLLHDIDLHIRWGARVEVQNGGTLLSDHFSETVGSGFEVITLTAASDPPLASGLYYVGVINYEPLEVPFSITGSHDGTASGPTQTPTSTIDPPTATPTLSPSASPTPTASNTPVLSATPTTDFLRRADFDGNGTIGHGDLLTLISFWGQSVGD